MAALAVLVVFNLLYAFPRYLSGDPQQSRIPLDPHFTQHYPVVVVHAVLGNLALVTVFLQILPWIRRHHPRVHRVSGRVYLFAAVLPTTLLAFALVPFSQAPFGAFGLTLSGVLWITTTVLGYRAVRRRRYVDHRRWMVYSFAISLGTTWGRVLAELMQAFPGFRVPLSFVLELSTWASWVINLLIAHWWLERTAPRAAQLVR
ncbi:DUF2306 domain-containing protein [Streptomyces ficellus]|uniref:DUF2306 domain-containing protein n=1 Tax=Streptomyces ficellus TaxID=1977088 RepID=A0ABT7YZZ3_9ACTN|nr:DUF2306 domain-containing protein [Streptomyces ficellus]MDN3292803.1 DUF2306 domain-containing protein [Streptomyces ficellus]